MESIQDQPTQHCYHDTLPTSSKQEKEQYLRTVLGGFVDHFVLNFVHDAPTILSCASTEETTDEHDHMFNYVCASCFTIGQMDAPPTLSKAYRWGSGCGGGSGQTDAQSTHSRLSNLLHT